MSTIVMRVALVVLAGTLAASGGAASAQSTQAVATRVIEFLEQQSGVYPGTPRVTVETSRMPPLGACDDLQVFLPSGQRLRPRMSVGLRCPSPQRWTARVHATLSIQGFFYVANRTIQPGETLGLEDISPRKGDILSLARGIIVDPSHAIGRISTRRIPMGATLKDGALRHPMSVQRGQDVTTEAHGRGFVATSAGHALEDGEPGQQIRVRTASGRTITATVVDAHTVHVML